MEQADPAVGAIGLLFIACAVAGYFYCKRRQNPQQAYARVQTHEPLQAAFSLDGHPDDDDLEEPPYATPIAHVPRHSRR